MGGHVIYTVQGRLQVMPCGVTGGAAYERRSLRKGRPSVGRVAPEKLENKGALLSKHAVAGRSRATDGERSLAMWGHSYTLILGLLVGH